ncbi:MAG: SpoIIE family protein phosphatase [Flavobacteriales bacterium]|nr:SpoIIE family protein phosphatase [Flavobacteriales bacterium]MCB9448770.1 SpoIIE family protein phosphatase [Flavobacteriales bacterium]
MIRKFILCAIFIAGNLIAHAQKYHFQRYSNEEGLSQSQVQCMLEDSQGYLWVATNGGGVNRFDGLHFQVFTDKEGLQNNSIIKMLEDADRNVWFMSEHEAGISYFDGREFTTLNIDSGLPSNAISDMTTDSTGHIWVATEKGVCMLSAEKGVEKMLTADEGLHFEDIDRIFKDNKGQLIFYSLDAPGASIYNHKFCRPLLIDGKVFQDTIRNIAQDYKGNYWIETRHGLRVIQYGDNMNDVRIRTDLQSNPLVANVTDLTADHDGLIWILTRDHVVRYDGNDFRVFSEEDGLPFRHPDVMLTDINGNIVFTYKRLGAAAYHNGKFTLYAPDKSFIDHPSQCALWDSQGTFWLGTNGAGIIKYPNFAFTYFDNESGLSSKIVFGIEQDNQGRMWFGTYGQGISVYDGKRFSYYNKENGFPSENAWSIDKDSRGNLWIATSNGLVCFDGKKFRNYTKKDGLPGDAVFVVFVDSKDRVWSGLDNGQAACFNGKTFQIFGEEDGLEHNVNCITEDQDGGIWFGTDGQGLIRITDHEWTSYTTRDGLCSDYIMHLIPGPRNQLWIATQDNGIGRFDGIGFTHINTTSGLSHNAVMSLVFDKEGNLWAGTNNGLNKISFNDYGNIRKIRHYQKLDGFIGIECNTGAAFCDNNGKLWFGSSVLVSYNPDGDIVNQIPPKTHITNIRLFFKELDLSIYADSLQYPYNVPYSITLPHDQNHLIIEFSGISLKVPEKIVYQYKMEGLDRDWSPYVSKTEAVYPNLGPGHYTFMVMARNEDKYWTEEPVKMEITILPPFWQTWYFYMLCSVAAILLIYGIVKWRIRNFKRDQAALEEKVRERTETITRQKNELEYAYNEIRDSIKYARRIQESILPPDNVVKNLLPDAFVFYRPKDIVSGDFYWIEQKGDTVLLAAVDCTGHGVPGAFMSIMGHSKLNMVVSQLPEHFEAAAILNELNAEVTNTLKKTTLEESAKDGMDITLCLLNTKTRELQYAGAYNPLYLIRDGILREIKGDKFPIGIFLGKQSLPFTNHRLFLQENDTFYLFSDGYMDQFGGDKNKKFMSSRFKNLLLDIHQLPMEEQRAVLEDNLDEWRGEAEQVDDILVLGVRV